MLCCYSSYLAWLPTVTLFLSYSYPYVPLYSSCESSEFFNLSHILVFSLCPSHICFPFPNPSLQEFVCHFLFEKTSKHPLFFSDHISHRQNSVIKPLLTESDGSNISFSLQCELMLPGCRSDLVAIACAPRLPVDVKSGS